MLDYIDLFLPIQTFENCWNSVCTSRSSQIQVSKKLTRQSSSNTPRKSLMVFNLVQNQSDFRNTLSLLLIHDRSTFNRLQRFGNTLNIRYVSDSSSDWNNCCAATNSAPNYWFTRVWVSCVSNKLWISVIL